ncbi:MAG: hypothetical protein R6X23_15890 [Acidimicrobiia bacterium]
MSNTVDGRRRGRLAALAAILATLLTLGISAAAGNHEDPANLSRAFPNVVEPHGTALSPSRLSQSSITWLGGATTASTGERLVVFVSASLPPDTGSPQTWADFLAQLVHGQELTALTSYIATPSETEQLCGPRALGCYWSNRMVSIGTSAYGISADEVVRHEYGHHIAFHRLNPPWLAIAWGPKHWASDQDICRRAAQGTVFPGDEGAHYRLNPGEAWAETYRVLDEQRSGATGSGWSLVDPSFVPGATTLAAAEKDVLEPWADNTTTVLRNRFTDARRKPWVIRLDVPLDGLLQVTVSLPKGGLQEVALLSSDRKTVLARALWAGSTVKRISTSVCGVRTLYVRVSHRGALGRVAVVVYRP